MTQTHGEGAGVAGPLAGLRVIELGGRGPVPFCGMVLSDLGADVIRIQRPHETTAPNPVLDRGRRALAVDLKIEAGVALVRRLVARADTVLEGFRPGVLERLGLSPAELRRDNPGLVVGRMTGFGQTGPAAQAPGHDINYLALSGALAALGQRDEPPRPPMNLLGDFAGGGMLLALGVLAAVHSARVTGIGQDVDAAMVDGAALLMAMAYGNYGTGRWSIGPGSDPFSGARPYYRTYACADGRYLAVGASEPTFFRALVETLDLGEHIDVARQTDPATWEEQGRLFLATFASRSRDEWVRRFDGVEACVTPVLSPDEAPQDPHLSARGTFFVGDAGITQPAPAPRFSATPAAPPTPAPRSGQHTGAILSELGVTDAEVAELRLNRVIG